MNIRTSITACAAAVLIATGTGHGKTIYQDGFGGEAGSQLQGRSPDTVDATGNTYTTLAPTSQLQVNGSGSAGTTGTGGVAWLPLPELSPGDVITLTAGLRPASNTSNFIAVGFSDGTSDLITNGTVWALLFGNGASNQGRIVVRSGKGENGVLYKSGTREPGWEEATTSTLTLCYNTRTGNLKVSLGPDTVFDGPLAFNDAVDTPAPISALSHVTLQWFDQNPVSHPEAGIFDSLKVEISPDSAETH